MAVFGYCVNEIYKCDEILTCYCLHESLEFISETFFNTTNIQISLFYPHTATNFQRKP